MQLQRTLKRIASRNAVYTESSRRGGSSPHLRSRVQRAHAHYLKKYVILYTRIAACSFLLCTYTIFVRVGTCKSFSFTRRNSPRAQRTTPSSRATGESARLAIAILSSIAAARLPNRQIESVSLVRECAGPSSSRLSARFFTLFSRTAAALNFLRFCIFKFTNCILSSGCCSLKS